MESKFKQLSDRNWLYDKYINNKLSSKKIGELLTCSDATVLNALKKHSIITRNSIKYPKLYDRNWLYKKYITETCSLRKIAKILGTSGSNVRLKLIKFNIPLRRCNERIGNAQLTKLYTNIPMQVRVV